MKRFPQVYTTRPDLRCIRYDAGSSNATNQIVAFLLHTKRTLCISVNCLNSSHVNSSPPHLNANSPVKGSESPTQQLPPEPVLIQQPPATGSLPQESSKVEQVQSYVLMCLFVDLSYCE